ncbi:MAG: hypothetical protein ACRC9V_00785, partial [Aeromonas sp.]
NQWCHDNFRGRRMKQAIIELRALLCNGFKVSTPSLPPLKHVTGYTERVTSLIHPVYLLDD